MRFDVYSFFFVRRVNVCVCARVCKNNGVYAYYFKTCTYISIMLNVPTTYVNNCLFIKTFPPDQRFEMSFSRHSKQGVSLLVLARDRYEPQ